MWGRRRGEEEGKNDTHIDRLDIRLCRLNVSSGRREGVQQAVIESPRSGSRKGRLPLRMRAVELLLLVTGRVGAVVRRRC